MKKLNFDSGMESPCRNCIMVYHDKDNKICESCQERAMFSLTIGNRTTSPMAFTEKEIKYIKKSNERTYIAPSVIEKAKKIGFNDVVEMAQTLYNQGLSLRKISEKSKINRGTISKILYRAGVTLKSLEKTKKEKNGYFASEKIIIDLYKKKKSLSQIGKIVGFSKSKVFRIVKKNGLSKVSQTKERDQKVATNLGYNTIEEAIVGLKYSGKTFKEISRRTGRSYGFVYSNYKKLTERGQNAQ